jgi:hypothetical protein
VDFIHETTDSFNVLLILCRWGFGSHSELVLCFYDEKCLLLIIICSVICLNLLLDISTFSFFGTSLLKKKLLLLFDSRFHEGTNCITNLHCCYGSAKCCSEYERELSYKFCLFEIWSDLVISLIGENEFFIFIFLYFLYFVSYPNQCFAKLWTSWFIFFFIRVIILWFIK